MTAIVLFMAGIALIAGWWLLAATAGSEALAGGRRDR